MSKIKVVFLLVLISFLNINCMKNKNKQSFKFLKEFNICEKEEEISEVAVSPNNQYIAVAKKKKVWVDNRRYRYKHYVEIWDLGDKKGSEKKIHGYSHRAHIIELVFSKDGTLLASCSENAGIKILQLKDKTIIKRLCPGSKSILGGAIIRFSSDNNYFVLQFRGNDRIHICNLTRKNDVRHVDVKHDIESFILSDDSKWLVISSRQFPSSMSDDHILKVDLYSLATGVLKNVVCERVSDGYNRFCFYRYGRSNLIVSSNGRYLVGGNGHFIFLYDLILQTILAKNSSLEKKVSTYIFFNNDKNLLMLTEGYRKGYVSELPGPRREQQHLCLDSEGIRPARGPLNYDLFITPCKKYIFWCEDNHLDDLWKLYFVDLDMGFGVDKYYSYRSEALCCRRRESLVKAAFFNNYEKMVCVGAKGTVRLFRTPEDLYFSSQKAIKQEKAKKAFFKVLSENKKSKKFSDLKVSFN